MPESLQGLRKEMIIKMAEAFAISDALSRTADNLCYMLDNAIQKARIMSEVNRISKDCVENANRLRQNLASRSNGKRIGAQVEGEISILESALEIAQQEYKDPKVQASTFRRHVDIFKRCEADTIRITTKIDQLAKAEEVQRQSTVRVPDSSRRSRPLTSLLPPKVRSAFSRSSSSSEGR